jgi:vitamin B12 transporter
MNRMHLAGLAGLVSITAHAQTAPLPKSTFDPIVVTALRTFEPVATLRDTVVLTREDIEDAGNLSLGELLQRRAGIELRATGGPGQPQSLFIRGAGSANTLVLIDGLRVGSATAGTTAIEAIPLDLIERIEVVKGPLSSVYGSDAAGGVVQVFTRGKGVPYFFASAAAGTDRDLRAATGLTTVDGDNQASLSLGVRRVDARSATNSRSTFSYDPDRDPHENAFANLRVSHRFWQNETLALEAFASRSRTSFDAGPPPPGVDDRSKQTLGGWRIVSSSPFASWWVSRLIAGQGYDTLDFEGQFPSTIRTRTDQVSWSNEFATGFGRVVGGYEWVRQVVTPAQSSDPVPVTLYSHDQRVTSSLFGSVSQSAYGQTLEASARYDNDDLGSRDTGTVSYGFDWPGVARLAGTFGRGFRAPTFNDLYATGFFGYTPNPDLKPEHSKSSEISLRALSGAAVQWRVTGFDNRFDDLIVATAASVQNVSRARIRGLEAALEATGWGVRWRASLTAQRPRDEDSDRVLTDRAERFGSIDASLPWRQWNFGVSVLASGPRYEYPGGASTKLAGYGVLDARARYQMAPHWTAELVATNLLDRRYESALGYDAPRRGVLLNVRFDSY